MAESLAGRKLCLRTDTDFVVRKPRKVFRLPTSDFRLPTSNFRLPASDLRLPTFRLETSDMTKFELRISDF